MLNKAIEIRNYRAASVEKNPGKARRGIFRGSGLTSEASCIVDLHVNIEKNAFARYKRKYCRQINVNLKLGDQTTLESLFDHFRNFQELFLYIIINRIIILEIKIVSYCIHSLLIQCKKIISMCWKIEKGKFCLAFFRSS